MFARLTRNVDALLLPAASRPSVPLTTVAEPLDTPRFTSSFSLKASVPDAMLYTLNVPEPNVSPTRTAARFSADEPSEPEARRYTVPVNCAV